MAAEQDGNRMKEREKKIERDRDGVRCLNESSKSVGCTFFSASFLGWPVVRVDELQLIVRSLMVGKTQ